MVIEDLDNPRLWHVMRQDRVTGKWTSKNGNGARWRDISNPIGFYLKHYQAKPREKGSGGATPRNLRVTFYSMPNRLVKSKS